MAEGEELGSNLLHVIARWKVIRRTPPPARNRRARGLALPTCSRPRRIAGLDGQLFPWTRRQTACAEPRPREGSYVGYNPFANAIWLSAPSQNCFSAASERPFFQLITPMTLNSGSISDTLKCPLSPVTVKLPATHFLQRWFHTSGSPRSPS